ncbi:MAG: DUF2393 domain-containing protein [Anaerolineae bacterium]|nr:DUF2393 domain-containing protein [Anaerolineae bacterium]
MPLVIRPKTNTVVISTYFSSETKFAGLVASGEIRNLSDLTIGKMVLQAKVYHQNNLIREVLFQPVVSATLPGQLNAFRVSLNVPSNDLPSYPTTIQVLTETIETSDNYRNLQVESITTSRSDDVSGFPGSAITITVRNNHPQPLHDVRIMVWSLSGSADISEYLCPLDICSGSSFVSMLSPNQMYTMTTRWRGIAGAVSPNAVIVVAQGVVSP